MNYELIEATNNDLEKLKYYKLRSILDYAINITEEEKNRIINYVNKTIVTEIKDYKIITFNNKKIGCLYAKKYNDGIMLDEIYIEEEYRNKKLGTKIIENLKENNNIIYLYVYKENKAYELYKKLDFKVIEETKSRYFMKYIKE